MVLKFKYMKVLVKATLFVYGYLYTDSIKTAEFSKSLSNPYAPIMDETEQLRF